MPHLTLVEQGSGKTHRVQGAEAVVGRDPACGVFLEGDEAKTVSGRHARFFFDQSRWFVEDAGSRNGTYIGTRKLEPGTRHQLAVGDVVGLGLTGTQLAVREVVGRVLAATMAEAHPPVPGGTAPTPRSEAIRPGINDLGAGEEVRVVLRAVQGGAKSIGQGARVTMGRALECLIRIEGESATSVSRVHAEIAVVDGKISIRDGGSRHGTFLNGKKIDGANPLKQGDVIMLGPGGPTFTVDDVSVVPAAPPSSPQPPTAEMRDASVNPTGVTPARKTTAAKPAAQQLSAIGDEDARHSTPGLGQPVFTPGTSPKGVPAGPRTLTAPVAKGSRFRGARGAVAIIVVVAATIAIAVQNMNRGQPQQGVRQQAADLEAIRTAALNDAANAKRSLDSALASGAAAPVVDSLRRAATDADRRVVLLQDSLKRDR